LPKFTIKFNNQRVKKFLLSIFVAALALPVLAQDSVQVKKNDKKVKKEVKRQRINAMIRQEEEGALIFRKQFVAGLSFKTNGYSLLFEMGRFKSRKVASIYQLELSESRHPKELKDNSIIDNGFTVTQGRAFIYGKQNSFYQVKLNYGQHRVLGSKGNKNGVAVSAMYIGGLSLGLLRPYYLKVNYGVDPQFLSDVRTIKYDENDSLAKRYFLDPARIVEGVGLSKGWGEMKIQPGLNFKTGLRFDYGRFHETVSALEAGVNIEYYFQKVPQMLQNKNRNLFFNAYIAIFVGKRKN
jgi:hypothetical protein